MLLEAKYNILLNIYYIRLKVNFLVNIFFHFNKKVIINLYLYWQNLLALMLYLSLRKILYMTSIL